MIAIRPGREADHPYVYSTFIRTCPRVCASAEGVPPRALAQLLGPLLDAWTLLVATPDDDDALVLGWLLYDERRVAWLLVGRTFERRGIATSLLAAANLTPGPVVTPFLPTRQALRTAIEARGYRLHHRPYLPIALAHGLEELGRRAGIGG